VKINILQAFGPWKTLLTSHKIKFDQIESSQNATTKLMNGISNISPTYKENLKYSIKLKIKSTSTHTWYMGLYQHLPHSNNVQVFKPKMEENVYGT
jgi:hypothetical protein